MRAACCLRCLLQTSDLHADDSLASAWAPRGPLRADRERLGGVSYIKIHPDSRDVPWDVHALLYMLTKYQRHQNTKRKSSHLKAERYL